MHLVPLREVFKLYKQNIIQSLEEFLHLDKDIIR